MRGECGDIGWSGQGGSSWIGRGGDLSGVATFLGDASRGMKVSELLTDRLLRKMSSVSTLC